VCHILWGGFCILFLSLFLPLKDNVVVLVAQTPHAVGGLCGEGVYTYMCQCIVSAAALDAVTD